MPNYDFSCQNCDHQFTQNVPIANRDNAYACPSCGSIDDVQRGVSAVQVSYSGFKDSISRAGNGWNDMLKRVKKGSGKENSIRTR